MALKSDLNLDMTKFPAEAYDREPENGSRATKHMMISALDSSAGQDLPEGHYKVQHTDDLNITLQIPSWTSIAKCIYLLVCPKWILN